MGSPRQPTILYKMFWVSVAVAVAAVGRRGAECGAREPRSPQTAWSQPGPARAGPALHQAPSTRPNAMAAY